MKTLPDNITKSLGLELVNINYADSFRYGSVFYQTKYRDLYLTNYDVGKPVGNDDNDLSFKGIWCLYYRASRMAFTYISEDFLNDADLFNRLVDHLFKNMTRQTVMGLEVHKN